MIIALGSAALVQIPIIFFLSTAPCPQAAVLPLMAALIVLLICAILFYKLTVEVRDRILRFWFGPGLISKSIRLEDIASCRAVRNSWLHGWGIHYCGKDGWVYNVSGMGAVAIELKSGKKLRIGTDEPEKLAEAIDSNLQQ